MCLFLTKKFFFFQNFFEYYFKICSLLPKILRPHIHKERIFSVEKESEENTNDLKRCIASTLTSFDRSQPVDMNQQHLNVIRKGWEISQEPGCNIVNSFIVVARISQIETVRVNLKLGRDRSEYR